jgi:hypothetical protein
LLPDGHWLGFDCAHYMDAKDESIMSPSYLKIHRKYDFGKEGTVWTHAMVVSETEWLADQIASAALCGGQR